MYTFYQGKPQHNENGYVLKAKLKPRRFYCKKKRHMINCLTLWYDTLQHDYCAVDSHKQSQDG